MLQMSSSDRDDDTTDGGVHSTDRGVEEFHTESLITRVDSRRLLSPNRVHERGAYARVSFAPRTLPHAISLGYPVE